MSITLSDPRTGHLQGTPPDALTLPRAGHP